MNVSSKIPLEWREFTDADREQMQRDDELRFMNGYVLNPSPAALARMIRSSAYDELRVVCMSMATCTGGTR